MSSQRDIQRLLDSWLSEGPTQMSHRALDSALDVIEHTQQRRVVRVPRWRTLTMTMPIRLAGAVAIVAVALIGGLFILRSPATVGTNPTASPSSSPSATPAASLAAAPSTDLFAGDTGLGGAATVAGVTYYTTVFTPPLTVRPGADWFVDHNLGTIVSLESGPGSPSRTPVYLVQILRPNQVVQEGQAGPIKAPADLIGWLTARSDLDLTPPTSITIGGIPATMVEGGLRAGAALNPEGGVNLICSIQSQCGYEGGELISVGPDGRFEFVVLDVRGAQVVIALRGPVGDDATDQATFDAFLAGLAFPGS